MWSDSVAENDRDADHVIVTALPEEREAVLRKLPGARKIQPQGATLVYHTAEIPIESSSQTAFLGPSWLFGETSGSQTRRVVVANLTDMGRVKSALGTAEAIRAWQPDSVLLVGIAGGFSPVRLGDVLLSNQIIDYELQKLRQDDTEYRPVSPPLSNHLLSAVQNLSQEEWIGRVEVTRPTDGTPDCHFGPVATGDKVVNDLAVIEKLRTLHPELIGVEMEAGGAAAAAHEQDVNFFMIRGVSDLADGKKDTPEVKRWREYACDVAAAFAVSLIGSSALRRPKRSAPRATKEDVVSALESISRVVPILDKFSDQIEAVISGKAEPDTPKEHRLHYKTEGLELTAQSRDQVLQVITGHELQTLPSEQLRHIRVLERSMENHYGVWEEVYPQLATMSDPVAKAKVNQQLKGAIRDAEKDLHAILDYLEDCGLYLDDHYSNVRHLIKQL